MSAFGQNFNARRKQAILSINAIAEAAEKEIVPTPGRLLAHLRRKEMPGSLGKMTMDIDAKLIAADDWLFKQMSAISAAKTVAEINAVVAEATEENLQAEIERSA